MRILHAAVLALTALSSATFAAEDSIVVSRPSVTVFHEFGSLIRGSDYGIRFEDYFVQRSGAWFNLKATRNERLSLNAIVGGTYWNPTYNNATGAGGTLRYFAAAVPRASIGYSAIGEPSKPTLSFEAGIFPYKYNDYTHNLGEYMFRSVAYPSQVYTGGLTTVDVNRATVTGLKATHRMGDVFSHDLILTLETDQLPYYDLNLTYMAKADVGSMLKFRAGAQFARIIPVKPSVTNADIPFNRYFTFNDTTYISNSEYYTQRLIAGSGDSTQLTRGENLATELKSLLDNGKTMEQALDTLEQIYGVTSQSSYDHYDASSIKTVVAFSFDPKPLLGGLNEFLGSQDLVLYGEAAILGLKNYPVLYEDRMERTVAMIGLNIPTFRQLDVLAFEMEWFGSRYPNSNEFSQSALSKDSRGNFLPLPQPTNLDGNMLRETQGYDPADWERDNIKWSVFARRQLVKGFSLDAQIASDNARGFTYPAGRRYWALFDKPSDWYWMMKLSASI